MERITGKFGFAVQNEAEEKVTKFGQEHTLVIANTFFQYHKRRLYTWTTPDGWYWTHIDYILCIQRREPPYNKQKQEADCGSHHELLIEKFRLKLKKVRITTRWFRYDLNQIPYDYVVEVTNRFKGLDLIECLKHYGRRFMTLYKRQWSRAPPRKWNAKRQNDCLRRPYAYLRKEEKLQAKEKRKDIPIWMWSSKEKQGEIKTPSSVIDAKK